MFDIKKFDWLALLKEVIRLLAACGVASTVAGCKVAMFNL